MLNRMYLGAVIATLFFLFNGAPFAHAQTEGQKELNTRMESIDPTDADQLCEVAIWAAKHKDRKVRTEGRALLKEVLELDFEHEVAHLALGHVLVGEEWYTSKKKGEAALKELQTEEMNGKGYTWLRGGWIKKDLKRQWKKKTWTLSKENIWLSPDDQMRLKGYVKYMNAWLPLSEDDRERMEKHRKTTGDDILIMTTEHFVLHLSVPPKYGIKYAEMVEKIYDWFIKEFEVPEERQAMLWAKGRAHIWTFRQVQQFQDWVTQYSREYKFTDKEKKTFRDHPGGWIMSGRPLATNVVKKAEDLENPLAHDVGHFLMTWHTLGAAGPWLNEGFANLCEEKFTGVGKISCSTLSNYGGKGDIAKKDFNTKDAPPRVRGLVRAGEDDGIDTIGKLGLNSLNGDHLSKGYSLVEWMFNHNKPAFIKFLKHLGANRGQGAGSSENPYIAAIRKAVANAFDGAAIAVWEDIWRKYVKKEYK